MQPRRVLRRSWIVGLLTLAACTATSSPGPGGRAALVVGHGDGTFTTTCVGFEGSGISGEDLLRNSGLAVRMDASNAMGPLICAIDEQGCDYPRQNCLCACRGTGGCSYWAYFNWSGDNGWSYGVLGAGQRQLHDGDMDAWIWLDRALPADELPTPPPEITFKTVCG